MVINIIYSGTKNIIPTKSHKHLHAKGLAR